MIGGDISMMCRGQAEAKDEFLKSYDLSKRKHGSLVKMLIIYKDAL